VSSLLLDAGEAENVLRFEGRLYKSKEGKAVEGC